jgi:AcrR family transcriptional regulator
MPARRRTSSPETARAAGRERRHARILDAAERLFALHGFAKTTVDEIASAAGVSKGLVYAHYESKEDLLGAVWERLVASWETVIRGTKLADGAVADAIGEGIATSIRHVRETPFLLRILAQDPASLTPHGGEGVAAFARFYCERLEPVLARGVRTGELRADLDVARTAETIWLLHHALVRELFVGHGGVVRGDAEALLRSAIELVVSGLRLPRTGRKR